MTAGDSFHNLCCCGTYSGFCRQRASQAEGQAKAREKESERLQKLLDMTRSSETDLSDKV